MDYKKINLGSYNLHLINTNKFKNIKVRVSFKKPVKKEDITFRNFLCEMMINSCLKYKTRRELVIETQDLYSVSISSDTRRLGNYLNSNFILTLLNEKYTEKGILDRSLDLLKEILFNPNVVNNKFDSKIFDIIKENTKNQIESIKEDPRKYSLSMMLEKMGPDKVYSYRGFGYEEDLNKITEENLYEFYKDFMSTNYIDVYVMGSINFDEIEEKIKNKFNFKSIKALTTPVFLDNDDNVREIKEYSVLDDKLQSKLSIGCKIMDLDEFESRYALTIYNNILGGGVESKFFKNIREKESLAYYIGSTVNKLDNLLLVSSGIDKKDYKQVLNLIEKQMKDMEEGNFSLEDIEKAKKAYLSGLDEIMDSMYYTMDIYTTIDLLGFDDIDTRRKKIMEVTKEDIIKVSKKIKMDTVFLLEGCEEVEKDKVC